jgi:hypothetical protein
MEIEIPAYDKTETVSVIGKHIVFAKIEPDGDASNPTDDDGFGTFYSHSTRHINFKHPDETSEILESDPDAVALSYFEHGNSLWMVAELPARPGVEFQWDGVRFAGIWVPDQCIRESYSGQDGLTRREWMVKQAKGACETYTQWCNGDVYGYNVEVFDLKLDDDGEPLDLESDYRRELPVFEDSCWGFYGYDGVTEALTEALPEVKDGIIQL